jgi:hypothetical protein
LKNKVVYRASPTVLSQYMAQNKEPIDILSSPL